MGSEWYVLRDGETFGPFTFDRMIKGAGDGELKREDLVWCEGMPDWQPAGDVSALWQPPALRTPPPLVAAAHNPEPERSRAPQLAAEDNTPVSDVSNDGEGQAQTQQRTANPKQVGFILRHWRGELTLAQAYWVVGFLLTVLAVWASNAFGSWLEQARLSPTALGLALTGFLSLLCALTVWQLVGIWRAAGNHMRSTGRALWGSLARLAVLIGTVRAIADFSLVVGPMLSESANLATGRDNVASYRLRLLRNGTELELAGGMSYGTADALKNLLDAAPAVKVVHLNSEGGWVNEGHKIHRLVRERKLATYTSADCVSACTIAFLGGSPRYLSPKARLGFHSSSFGTLDQKRLPEINSDLSRMLYAHGVPSWFVDKALSTSSKSMRYPSPRELIDAKIVTRVVDPDRFGMSSVGDWRNREALERSLLSIPFYALVRGHDPEGFKKIADRFAEAVKLGKSEAELIQDVQAVFGSEILPKYLGVAPDGAIHRYWRTQLAEMEHLGKIDPAHCVAYAFPEQRREGYNLNKLIPPALFAEDIAALTELIAQAIRAPVREKSPNLDEEAEGVFARISKRIPGVREVLAEPHRYFNDPQTLCTALTAFYTDVLSLPAVRSGPMLRSIADPVR